MTTSLASKPLVLNLGMAGVFSQEVLYKVGELGKGDHWVSWQLGWGWATQFSPRRLTGTEAFGLLSRTERLPGKDCRQWME
eukprot:2973022-Amphidinium_carterae.1